MFQPFIAQRLTINTERQEYEVADVFRQYWAAYRERYPVSAGQVRVAEAIMRCRTAAQGGRVEQCVECGAWRLSFNSCKDRHCPKCGSYEKARWLEAQRELWLATRYYHVVFTVAHELNGLIWRNQRVLYDLLFAVSSKLLKVYGRQYLGGEIGATGVLHTWGQQLEAHAHIHYMVTGGALVREGPERWRWQSSGEDFLFPVVALSAAYREALCDGVLRLARAGRLWVLAEEDVEALVAGARGKRWEVYIGRCPPGVEVLQEYLSRYIYRIAISNHRLERVDEQGVTFRYRDNRDGGKEKTLRLSGEEFLRRFLLHVLPKGYVRVRQYGLHHSQRRRALAVCRRLLGGEAAVVEKLTLGVWLERLTGTDGRGCPQCGGGPLVTVLEFGGVGVFGLWVWWWLGLQSVGVVRRRAEA